MSAPRSPVPRHRIRVGTILLAVAAAAMLVEVPLAGGYTHYVLALIAIQVIAVLSLNLLMGYAGQISLGQAAFVGVGAYAAAQFVQWRVPFALVIPCAALATAAIATVVGLPSLRIKGLELAATTLAFGVMAQAFVFERPWDKKSNLGMAAPRPRLIADDRAFLILALSVLALVIVLDASIRRSRVGRAFMAVRDREDTAAARGIPVSATKLLAYALSGLYAGLAGGCYAFLLERVTPSPFSVWESLGYVAAVVVGGAGSLAGVALAQTVFTGLPELLRSSAKYSPLAGAALLMTLPIVRPEGLGWFMNRRIPLVRRRAPSVPALSVPVALDPPHRPVALAVPVRTLLSARDVKVRFGGLNVLTGVDLDVHRGESVGLIGPNGAGKTTMFNCLSGFVRPHEGRIEYRHRDLLALPAHARPGLGIIRTFQSVGLCADQTVWENLLLAQHYGAQYSVLEGLAHLPKVWAVERKLAANAGSAMAAVAMSSLGGERLGALPQGKQRLAEVATALAAGPELLLLDEPAAGMSAEEADELRSLLLDLRDRYGLTLLVIDHHVPFVTGLCDYVYVMVEGHVMAQGTPAQIQRDPAVAAVYLGSDTSVSEGVPVHA